MLQKIVLLKNWNCFKISLIWRNSYLFDMLFSQKLQWVLLLQDYFKIQKCDPILPTKILLLTRIILKTFQEKKKRFLIMLLVMLCSILSCFSWHILLQGQEFWVPQLIPHVLGQKVKFTIHLSLFTCYYSLRNFAYLRGVVPYISSKFLVWELQVFSVLSSGLLS